MRLPDVISKQPRDLRMIEVNRRNNKNNNSGELNSTRMNGNKNAFIS
jgi:hypothetical protein